MLKNIPNRASSIQYPEPMPQNPYGRNPFVAIAGNIGVGKTTLTKLLVERFGWTAFFEKEVANPYLADFYQDMPAWAFQSQIFFLKERIKDHLQIQATNAPCVQDRTIYEDAEIFAHNLFERGLMHARDYACYADLYAAISSSLRPPDLFVYLRASTWTLISRIRKRGRDYEQNIDKEYLAQLNLNYERWAKRIVKKHNVVIVDTDEHEVYRDKDWLEGVIEEIQKRAA
jgi:deoxyadenosine/deoxycytidine kinase